MESNQTDEEKKVDLEDAASKVLFPETDIKKIKFLGKEIDIRPLPIALSKKIANQTSHINKGIDKLRLLQKEGKELSEIEDKIGNMDLLTIDTMVQIVLELTPFYDLKYNDITLTKEIIEDKATPPELINFVSTQVEVASDNDFLLKPLSMILQMVKISTKDLAKLLLNTEFMQDSANTGTSPSTNLSKIIQKDS